MSSATLDIPPTTLVGIGVMGRALLGGLLRAGADASRLSAVTRDAASAEQVEAEFGVAATPFADAAEVLAASHQVVMCLKPHKMEAALGEMQAHLAADACLISIAAGVRLQELEGWCGPRALLRVMPNTPSRVGAGMIVVSPGEHAASDEIEACLELFRPLGRTLVLDEEHMDAVTGLSASGPAFVYVVIEALTDGGVMTGLPRATALELATQAVLGAARMVLETGQHPAELKDAVTTPAGCTISALLRLEDGGLRSVLSRGVQEAAQAAGQVQSKWNSPNRGR